MEHRSAAGTGERSPSPPRQLAMAGGVDTKVRRYRRMGQDDVDRQGGATLTGGAG